MVWWEKVGIIVFAFWAHSALATGMLVRMDD
jgi:hypothetical protein